MKTCTQRIIVHFMQGHAVRVDWGKKEVNLLKVLII